MRRDISQAGFGANLGFLPHPKSKAMLGQQFLEQRKAFLILLQIGIGVLFDFHDFLVGTPIDQNVWSVAMFGSLMVVVENEGLLLPCARMPSGEQNLECLEFILRFSVPRAPTQDVRDFALYTRLRPAHWLANPL